MKPSAKRKFGRTSLEVTAFSFGTAPIGNIFKEIDEETSLAMFDRSWEAGIRYFDTSPYYGFGLAELRTGQALRWRNRDDFVLSSKVGRVLHPARRDSINFSPWVNAAPFRPEFDYSFDGTMRSFEDSLQRLALERMDIVYIHDVDFYTHGDGYKPLFNQAMDGCYKALARLRDEKVVGAIGMGLNEWEVCHEALKQRDFDCFLLAGRYTLLEQNALSEFLPLCEARGTAIVVGGGFNSGILATGAIEGAKYNYAPAPADIMQRVAQIESVCKNHHVPLPAAALQFVVAHPSIVSFCAGTRTCAQLEQNLDWMDHPIPADFWQELKAKGLLREEAPVPA